MWTAKCQEAGWGFERWIMHGTLIEETRVDLLCETKPHSFPEPNQTVCLAGRLCTVHIKIMVHFTKVPHALHMSGAQQSCIGIWWPQMPLSGTVSNAKYFTKVTLVATLDVMPSSAHCLMCIMLHVGSNIKWNPLAVSYWHLFYKWVIRFLKHWKYV